MKAPFEADLVKIHITRDCPRACSNCSDLTPYFPKRQDMELASFTAAAESLHGWLRPGSVVGIAGGEPTLHPDFERFSQSHLEILNLPVRINSRVPVAELQDLALPRLMERDGVCGLWTSLGEGFYRHYETIFEVYGHVNMESHGCGKRHHAVMIDRDDYAEITGQSDEQWLINRDACAYQRAHGAAINDRGAYFCDVAASLDRLLYDGAHAWPVENGWWNRKVKDFGAQLSLCDYCALAQPTPAQVDSVGRDILGRKAHDRLKATGATQPFELFSRHHRASSRIIDHKPFTAGATPRVAPGHTSIKPRKLSCVLVSVGYGQALSESLPRNMAQFDQVVVVTTPEDETSRKVAKDCGATLVLSRRCYDDNHAFNKGRMLNDGVAALEDPDWIVFTDADITMNESLRAHVMSNAFNPGCLYFTSRREHGQASADQSQPSGYFQLFNPKAIAIRDHLKPLQAEDFCSAGSVDSWFQQQWPREKVVAVPELEVEHLAPQPLGAHWNGPKPTTGKWTQLGVLTTQGFASFLQITQLPEVIRLTDTLFGESVIIETKDFEKYVQLSPSGLTIQGRNIGFNHIHVAYKS